MTDSAPKLLLPLSSVAEMLAVSPHTIRKWVKQGRLQPTRVCRRLLFQTVEIERFIEQGRVCR